MTFLRAYYASWQRLVPVDHAGRFFRPSFADATEDDADLLDVMAAVFDGNAKLRFDTPEDHIANSMYFEARTFLHGLLVVQDRVSAAHGIEERVPFLDNDLVEFATRLPVRFKLADLSQMKRLDENDYQKRRQAFTLFNGGKNVLRVAMRGLLPEAIVERDKQGFSAPDGSWYRGEALAYVERTLLRAKDIAYAEFINPDYVRRVFDEHVAGKANHRLLIWSLLSFEHWCRRFLLDVAGPSGEGDPGRAASPPDRPRARAATGRS
jgi:asparagine synthase (glutamine-hydrolysing)